EICPEERLLHLTVESSIPCGARSRPGGDAGTGDAVYQSEAGGGNAAQQTTVVWGGIGCMHDGRL
ncbi:MAG: hypothetical protein ACRES1_08510, partial [Steroidobacteraceae bacterium]